jgi:hypothetical protein
MNRSSLRAVRSKLEQLGIDHRDLTDLEVFHMNCALSGWHVTPRTRAGAGPITARVWLAAALVTGGRYLAPDTPGHPAELGDGGPPVDSVVLMAIVQRNFLKSRQPAWDDEALAEALGLDARDLTRAQAVLDALQPMIRRARAPLGTGWWERAEIARRQAGGQV